MLNFIELDTTRIILNSQTESCVVARKKAEVFEYLSNIENLPEWAKEFVGSIKKIDQEYKASTSIGEVLVKFTTDEKSGVIDIYIGPTSEKMSLAAMRVIEISENSTAVTFTIFQYDDVDYRSWKVFCDYIRKEIANIEHIFA